MAALHFPRTWMRFFGLMGFVVVYLTACGSAPAQTPTATIAAAPLPVDWQRIDLGKLTLALPAEWVLTSPEELDVSNAVTEMAVQNPQLKAVLEQGRIALGSGQVQLIAYDVAPERLGATAFPTNLRVGQQTFAEAPTLNAVSDANEQELRATAGFSDVERTAIMLGDQSATRLRSTLRVNDPLGEQLQLTLEQYLVLQDKELYIITLTTPTSQQAAYRPIFDQILATTRLEPAP